MKEITTDSERLDWLLEAEAELLFDIDSEITAEAKAESDEASTAAPEELPEDKRPMYITNYIGSKQKLTSWIWSHTPQGVSSAFDAFSGSAAVAYMYKSKGLRVAANDRLRYAYHTARAIIENNKTRLSDAEIEALLKDNPKAGTFVRDNFKGLFYTRGVHALIDTIRANCDELTGYKKDIALFALGKTALSAKAGFGHGETDQRPCVRQRQGKQSASAGDRPPHDQRDLGGGGRRFGKRERRGRRPPGVSRQGGSLRDHAEGVVASHV